MPYNIESVVDSAVIEIMDMQKKINLVTATIVELEEKMNRLTHDVSRLKGMIEEDDGK